MYTALKPYEPGGEFISYTKLTASDKRLLSAALDRLAEHWRGAGQGRLMGSEHGITRRSLLQAGAAAGVGAALGAGVATAAEGNDRPQNETVDFYGEHQAGITTPAQDRLLFASLDLTTTRREDLTELLAACGPRRPRN